MGVLIGFFDPIKLIVNTLNQLMQKGIISVEESRMILYDSLDPSMSDKRKNEILNNIMREE